MPLQVTPTGRRLKRSRKSGHRSVWERELALRSTRPVY